MAAGISRSSTVSAGDPHGWNTWDHYRTIHDSQLEKHPFVNRDMGNTLRFTEEGGEILLSGRLYCLRDVVLEVENRLEVRYFGQLMRVRGYSFRYAGWVEGGESILRYHNIHRYDDDYHHRVFDPRTGEEILHERLHRHQFPTLSEVLDELEILAGMLDG